MDIDVDHYWVLGLPSEEEGSKLTEKEISKAYRIKALELHPDKKLDDPDAHVNFMRLKSSYEILKDEKARKLFDDLRRIKRQQQQRHLGHDSKRRKMVSDLEERERAAFAPDTSARERKEEEMIARKLKEEIARIRAMHAKKGEVPTSSHSKKETAGVGNRTSGGASTGLDKDRMLNVSWEKTGEEYSAEGLKEIFSKFGAVEDVVIKHKKKKGSALIVMATKEAAVAATSTVCGHLSNPLLVLPLQPILAADFRSEEKPANLDRLNNLVGAGYQAFEDSVLKKLQKAAGEKQKGSSTTGTSGVA